MTKYVAYHKRANRYLAGSGAADVVSVLDQAQQYDSITAVLYDLCRLCFRRGREKTDSINGNCLWDWAIHPVEEIPQLTIRRGEAI